MYKCERDKEPVYESSCGTSTCSPGFNTTAPDGSTIKGKLNDTCIKKCKCLKEGIVGSGRFLFFFLTDLCEHVFIF